MIEKLPQLRNELGMARLKADDQDDPDQQQRDPLEAAG